MDAIEKNERSFGILPANTDPAWEYSVQENTREIKDNLFLILTPNIL